MQKVLRGRDEATAIAFGSLVSHFMERQLAAFVEQPCRATYLAARDAVLATSPLPLRSAEIADLDLLLEQDEHERLLDRLDTLPASKVLSPRIHFLAAEAAAALGNADDEELERSLFVLTLQGLLSTGDGTPANPYVVCHSSDEYDVLTALGREPAAQSLVEHSGRLCDILRCSDGREIWFDVTHLLTRRRTTRRRPNQRLRAGRRLMKTDRAAR